MCDSYFTIKCLLESNTARVTLLNYLMHRVCLIQCNTNLYKQVGAKIESINLTYLYFQTFDSLAFP